jgi:hypothetical protein
MENLMDGIEDDVYDCYPGFLFFPREKLVLRSVV